MTAMTRMAWTFSISRYLQQKQDWLESVYTVSSTKRDTMNDTSTVLEHKRRTKIARTVELPFIVSRSVHCMSQRMAACNQSAFNVSLFGERLLTAIHYGRLCTYHHIMSQGLACAVLIVRLICNTVLFLNMLRWMAAELLLRVRSVNTATLAWPALNDSP